MVSRELCETVYFIFYMYSYITVRWTQQRCLTWKKKKWLSIIHSITRTYSLIRSTDRQFRNGTKNEIYKQALFFKTDRYSNHFNTLIPTLDQSKSFKFEDPRSHAPETNAELMISPKKMISSMLAPIPVIYEKNWYVQGGSNMTGTVYTCLHV